MGAVKPAEFTADHAPAFVKGDAAGEVRCACTRSCARPSGTCCPARNGRELLREHGDAGREFPEVLANTTSAFGLGDWEWILAFEADEPTRWWTASAACATPKARLYTKVEIPFVTGIRKSVADVLDDLV